MSTDRMVVVTSGTSGIGLGVVERFAGIGHPVSMLDIQDATLERESERLQLRGARILARKIDIHPGGCRCSLRHDPRRAGMHRHHDRQYGNFGRNRVCRCHGLYLTAHDRHQSHWWVLCRTSSIAGRGLGTKWPRHHNLVLRPSVCATHRRRYSAAEAGVTGLTFELVLEYAGQVLTVDMMPASMVATPMAEQANTLGTFPPAAVIAHHIPITRLGSLADLAAACEYLASNGASYVTSSVLP